uniref:Uncharacterized protein n=1 Tax=Thermorudis peleae TaxID=1382356 RepID=A0A831T9E4_9BACT
MRDEMQRAEQRPWGQMLETFAAALYGPERARELETEIARMAEALERLSEEGLDLWDAAPDLRGVPGEESA